MPLSPSDRDAARSAFTDCLSDELAIAVARRIVVHLLAVPPPPILSPPHAQPCLC